MSSMLGEADFPAVLLEAESQYVLGFPMIIAVNFDNSASNTQFLSLPKLTLWATRGGFSLRFEPVGSGSLLEIKSNFPEMEEEGVILNPGESKRNLLDLSNFATGLQPGRYRVSFALHAGRHKRASSPIDITFVEPNTTDAAEAVRLRRLGKSPIDTGAWAPFLMRNWNTVVRSSTLSPGAARQLQLHLFLHRAFYGPRKLNELDVNSIAGLEGPVLGPERALLELEILVAKNGPHGAQEVANTIVRKWPSLGFRVDQIKAGEGLLTMGRKSFGIESELLPTLAHYPYSE